MKFRILTGFLVAFVAWGCSQSNMTASRSDKTSDEKSLDLDTKQSQKYMSGSQQTGSFGAGAGSVAPGGAAAKGGAGGGGGAAGFKPGNDTGGDPCDPKVIANDKKAAEECFKKKAWECGKGIYKGVPETSGVVDQKCVETVIQRCQACATDPNANACSMCLNAALAQCTTLPSIPLPLLDTYRACMMAATAGLGTAFLNAWDDIYDQKTQIDYEMRKVACDRELDKSFVCTSACAQTNSCINANDPINRSQAERCELCYKMCKHNSNYCSELANE